MRDEQITVAAAASTSRRVFMSLTHWRGLSIFAVLCLAAAFRLYRIQAESVWYDEVMSMYPLHANDFDGFLKLLHSDNPAVLPLYFVVEYVVTRITGTSVLALRLMSVCIGLLAVFALYGIGRRLFGHTAGLISAACLALSQRHIYYDQEIRMYALTYLIVLLSIATLCEALRRGQFRWWVLHIACNGLLIWTHILGGALLIAEGLFLLIAYSNQWKLTVAWGLAHIPFLVPIAWWLNSDDFGQAEYVTSWIKPASVQSLFYHYRVVLTGQISDARIVYSLGIPVSSQVFTATILLALACWALIWTFRERVAIRVKRVGETEWHATWVLDNRLPESYNRYGGYNGRTILLLVFAYIIPPLVLFILSLTVEPCFVARYFLYSSFPLFLLGGAGVAALKRPVVRTVIGVVLVASFALQAYALDRPFRTDFANVAKVYKAMGKADDLVLVTENGDPETLDFGYGMSKTNIQISHDPFGDALREAELGHDAWIFFRTEAPYLPITLESKLEHKPYHVDRFNFPGAKTLAVYRISLDGD